MIWEHIVLMHTVSIMSRFFFFSISLFLYIDRIGSDRKWFYRFECVQSINEHEHTLCLESSNRKKKKTQQQNQVSATMCKIRNLVFVGALIYHFDYVDHTNFPWFRISSQILRFISGESKKEQKHLLFVVRTHTCAAFIYSLFPFCLVYHVLFALLSFHSTLEPSRLLLLLLLLLCVFFWNGFILFGIF